MLWIRRSLVMLAVIAVQGTAANAQYYYPWGYGTWGWGGWGPGSTPQGDVARGLGVFAAGAGVYNEKTAEAAAINADTAMRWNQYLWLSQQEANRRYHARLARDVNNTNRAREEIYRRLRDNPEMADIMRGDALNVALDEILNPRVYYRALKAASARVPRDWIRDIPFENAAEAITISLDQLINGDPPDALKAEAFEADRERLKQLISELRNQIEQQGRVDPATLQRLREATHAMQEKVEKMYPSRDSRQRIEAERYLKALYGLTRMMETPEVHVLLAGLENRPDPTLADLLTFMNAYNLRFGPATTPRQREIYTQLYPLLDRARDEAVASLAGSVAKPDTNAGSRATEFFAGMPMRHLERRPSSSPTPAPTPAPTPPPPGPR